MGWLRLKRWLIVTALAAGVGAANAQSNGDAWHPRTGDAWVDTWLADMNRYASRYREPFIDELERYHGAPRALVRELLVQRGWPAGDVYFACALAQALDRPCREVVDAWSEDRAQGGGVLARRLGVGPGSPAFQRIKQGFVPTYDRWSRPITLDAELSRAAPGHDGRGRPDRQDTPGRATPEAARSDGKRGPSSRAAREPIPGKD